MTRRFLILMLLGWVLLECSIIYYLRANQARWVESWSTTGNQQSWDQFREDSKKFEKQKDGTPPQGVPIQRRTPGSAQPPVLVLLRDYFTMIQVGAVLFSTVLYGVCVFLTRGLLTPPDILAQQKTPHAET
jgi:hypothetical protein